MVDNLECGTAIKCLTEAHQAVAPAPHEYDMVKKEMYSPTTWYEYLKRDYPGNFKPQTLSR